MNISMENELAEKIAELLDEYLETEIEDLTNINNLVQLEKKEDMKKRGLQSPDIADALALTYAFPVYPSRAGYDGMKYTSTQHEYDPI